MLAWIDSLSRRRTTLSLAVVVAYMTSSYHLVRAGLQNYIFGSVAPYLIPFALFRVFLFVARARPATSVAPLPRARPTPSLAA
jgi:hypothetical protein